MSTSDTTPAVPMDGGREAPWGVEDTGDHLWIGPMRPDGMKVERVVYARKHLKNYKPEYGERARADAKLTVDAINAALTPSSADAGAGLREALEWYGEQARLARLIHREGDAGRHALQEDGGKRAVAALAALAAIPEGAGSVGGGTPWKAGHHGFAREAIIVEDEHQIVELGVRSDGQVHLILHRATDSGAFEDMTARLSVAEAGRIAFALNEAAALSAPPAQAETAGEDIEAGMIRMLQADNVRMRAAGLELSEAALRVVREYDGTHRLSLAVAGWVKAIANEGGREERHDKALAAHRHAAQAETVGNDEADDLLWLRGQVILLCEDTEDKALAELEKPGLIEHAEGFYKGKRYEAKGIRRAIVEVVRCRLAERAAHRHAAQAGAGDGFVWVPVKPTNAMVEVGVAARWKSAVRDANCIGEIWRAMLAAAPIGTGNGENA